jgi:Mn-dependent DtxR family transcriptional regulator
MAKKIQESGEMYLEHIYCLTERGGVVRSVDVAKESGYSKPSVSRAVGLLKENGYIRVADDGAITLTDTGRTIAQRIYARHQLLTRILRHLGVSEEIADHDACKIEHDLSDETVDALRAFAEKNGL